MTAKEVLRYVLGFAMITVGIFHFVSTPFFVSIVPPALPYPYLLVWVSGAIEIGLGILMLISRTQRIAGWLLIALFIAIFPANIYMAMEGMAPAGVTTPVRAWAGWARLPLQFVLIAWAYWYTRGPVDDSEAKRAALLRRARS